MLQQAVHAVCCLLSDIITTGLKYQRKSNDLKIPIYDNRQQISFILYLVIGNYEIIILFPVHIADIFS